MEASRADADDTSTGVYWNQRNTELRQAFADADYHPTD
jgi:hypothetical protein